LRKKGGLLRNGFFGLFVARYYEECCKLSELINLVNKTQVPVSRKAFDQMTVSWVVTQCRIRRFGRMCCVHISCG